MSLTSVLKSHADLRRMIPNLKPLLTDFDGSSLRQSDWRTPILVPSIGKSFEAGILGMAYDYVARAIVTRMVGQENVKARRPVASVGASFLLSAIGRQEQSLLFEQDDAIRAERMQGLELVEKHEKELMDFISGRLNTAMEAIQQYVSGKINLKQIALNMVFMAKLDAVYRAGSVLVVDDFFQEKFRRPYFSQKLSVSDTDLAENVALLAEVFQQHFCRVPMTRAMLNPEFGAYSGAVGGADADLIIDSTLIDLKSSNKLSYSTEDWAQVLAYAAMGIALGIEIERVAIHYARYGVSTVLYLEPNLTELLMEYLTTILKTVGIRGGKLV